jgi:hypothetical protein
MWQKYHSHDKLRVMGRTAPLTGIETPFATTLTWKRHIGSCLRRQPDFLLLLSISSNFV